MHSHRRFTVLFLALPLAALAMALSGCTAAQPSEATAVAGDGYADVSFASRIPGGEYQVIASPGFSSVTTGLTRVRITGLENGTAYTFAVRMKGMNGYWSEWSAPTAPVVPKGAPKAPSISAVTGVVDLSGCTARVTVTPAGDGGAPITGYEVTADGFPPVHAATSPVEVPGLATHASYDFTVKALNAFGASPASATFAGTCT